eukprot:gene1251-biopygen13824
MGASFGRRWAGRAQGGGGGGFCFFTNPPWHASLARFSRIRAAMRTAPGARKVVPDDTDGLRDVRLANGRSQLENVGSPMVWNWGMHPVNSGAPGGVFCTMTIPLTGGKGMREGDFRSPPHPAPSLLHRLLPYPSVLYEQHLNVLTTRLVGTKGCSTVCITNSASGRNGHARVRSASGPRPFLQILSCAPRPVRVRCRFTLGEQDTGAWRGRGAGYRLQFGMSGAGARAWRGHVLFPLLAASRPRPRPSAGRPGPPRAAPALRGPPHAPGPGPPRAALQTPPLNLMPGKGRDEASPDGPTRPPWEQGWVYFARVSDFPAGRRDSSKYSQKIKRAFCSLAWEKRPRPRPVRVRPAPVSLNCIVRCASGPLAFFPAGRTNAALPQCLPETEADADRMI